MEKKPVVFVAKDAKDAAKRLNEYVEKGSFNFEVGVLDEYVTTVSKNSDGTTSKTKEKHFRFTGFADTYVGEELDSFNKVREESKLLKKEREELDRSLNVINKSAFAPLSVFLLVAGLILSILGGLTVSKVLPLPEGQLVIAIVLLVVGVLAIGGSILAYILRKNKKAQLMLRKDEFLKHDDELKAKESSIDQKIPAWYKDALWTSSGDTVKNKNQSFTLKK